MSAVRTHLSLHALTLDPLVGPPAGERVLGLIEQHAPQLLPDRYGPYEPFEQRYAAGGLAAAAAMFDERSFLWDAPVTRVSGAVAPRRFAFDLLARITIRFPADDAHVGPAVGLLQAFATEFGVEFGALHLVSKLDRPRGRPSEYLSVEDLRVDESDYLSLATPFLKRWIPDLFWCTVFGPSYIRLFGRERLEAVDAHETRFLSDDVFWLRFSDDPNWIVDNRESFESAREAAKQTLGPDAFFDAQRGPEAKYRTADIRPR